MRKITLGVIILVFNLTNSSFAQVGDHVSASEIRTVQPTRVETVAEIMERAKNFPDVRIMERPEREYPDRSNLRQNPLAKPIASFPENANGVATGPGQVNSLTISTNFNGVTGPDETGAYPPDNMGSVGPTQYIVFVNGRLRSFNKTTGVADGVLNVNPDAFFAPVMTPIGAGVLQNFTSDPRVRYDRRSGKWILLIIDVPCTNASCTTTAANRVLIAYSNSSTITNTTTWTFTQFTGQAGAFLDYPTLGVDVNAIYIGGNMFTLAGAFAGTNGYVINRNTLLSGGAYTVYSFIGLAGAATAGPITPQGVDNFDTAPTEGYFIGVDNIAFSLLQIRRVSTPAGVPTLSGNISLTVPTTGAAVNVPNLGGVALDGIDDRLYAATIRNGRLWTAHAFRVTAAGVAGSTQGREGCRWYEIQNLTTTPALVQSGTIFDNAATAAAARWHWFPSVMVSGQGHAAFGMTTAGSTFRVNAVTTGRLAGDPLGTTQAIALTTASSTAYSVGNNRWGDYSYVSLDPLDDMTMWMINQHCVATNKYGSNVTKLLAPPPATPASTFPNITAAGQTSVNVIVTGTAVSGSGFYDPGTNLPAPALPFNHISATVSGGVTVNSVTYTDPTHVTLNLNTVGSPQGLKNISITNPDGQVLTGTGIFQILGFLPITLKELKGKLNNNLTISLNWITSTENGNKGFFVERTETFDQSGWQSIGFVNGIGYSTTESNYALIDNNIQLDKIYRYRLKQVDFDGNYSYSNEIVIKVKDLQKTNLLLTSYPNPFNAVSTIKYNLPHSGMVSVKVFDILGKEVGNLVSGFQQPGLYAKEFNAEKLNALL